MATLAQRLAGLLADRNDTLFGLPGGGPNLDVIGAATETGMRFVLTHGETAAAMAAATYGLLTGSPAAAVVTRGPGAASAANGIAQATLDRYPLIAVTDSVPSASRATVSHQRIDQRAMLAPLTRASVTASAASADADLAAVMDHAGRWPSGAVHLNYDVDGPPGVWTGDPAEPAAPDAEHLDRAKALMAAARRPVVIVGMEAAVHDHARPARTIREGLERLGVPVLSTYQAIGTVPTDSPLHAGLFTNAVVERPVLEAADLIVAVGLDTVEAMPGRWYADVPVIELTATPEPVDDLVPATVRVCGDLTTSVDALVDRADHTWDPGAGARFDAEARRRLRPEPTPRFGPVDLVDAALDAIGGWDRSPTVTVDAGAHFLAVMPFVAAARPFDVLISNGLATMGFALPAAIGAALARPDRPVVAFTGDGGLAMALAELETLARLDLPVTVVVFNDAALSLIALKQGDDQPGGHGGDAAIRYRPTDFATIASAHGVDGVRVESATSLGEELAERRSNPRLIDARIDPGDYRHLLTVTRG